MSDIAYFLKSFMRSLKKRAEDRRLLAKGEETEAYRIFDREHDVPLSIDIYAGKYLIITYYDDGDAFDLDAYVETAGRALYIATDRIFVKRRGKLRGENVQRAKLAEESREIWVVEAGLSFKINLSDYIDSGLFLDHRIARGIIRDEASDKRVLNLFCYTGSFSVYAAAGGASFIKSVDISQRYLDWATENFARNGLLSSRVQFQCEDVFSYLATAVESRERYDIIIIDPPVFSNGRGMEKTLNIKRDYANLINSACAILNPAGYILFSTPCVGLSFDARKIIGFCEEITNITVPYDFRRTTPHRSWLIKVK